MNEFNERHESEFECLGCGQYFNGHGTLSHHIERCQKYLLLPSDDSPENLVMIRCTECHKSSYSAQWIANRGQCPLCMAYFKGALSEDLT